MAQTSSPSPQTQEIEYPQEHFRHSIRTKISSLQRLQDSKLHIPPRLLLCITIGTLALTLNLYRLGSPSLWFDEVLSVERARQPLSVLWQIVSNTQQNMALYYIILHFWLGFTTLLGLHTTEFVVRFPSAIFAALGSVVVFLLGRRLLGTIGGIVGATLYVLNSLQLVYAQETRSYSLQLLLICMAWYALFVALSTASRQKRWWAYLCYGAAMILAVYTQLFSLVILFAQVLAIAGLVILPSIWRDTIRRRLLGLMVSLVGITLFVIPILFSARHSAKTAWLAIPHLVDIYKLFLTISGNSTAYLLGIAVCCAFGVYVGLRLLQEFLSLTHSLKTQGEASGICILWGNLRARADKSAMATINRALRFTRKQYVSTDRDEDENRIFCATTAFVGDFRRKDEEEACNVVRHKRITLFEGQGSLWPVVFALVCWLVVPVVVSYIVSQGSTRLFSSRYLVAIVPPLFLLVGLGIAVLRWRIVQVILATSLILVALHHLPQYYNTAQVENWRSPALWLEQHYQAGDGLVCYDNAEGCQISMEYYFRGYPTAAHFTADSPGAFPWATYDITNHLGNFGAAVDPAALAAYAAKHPRLFFIAGRIPNNVDAAQANAAQHWLDTHYHFVTQTETSTVTIRLYVIGGTAPSPLQ